MAEGRRPSVVTIAAALVFMLGLGTATAAFLGPVVFPETETTDEPATTVATVPIDESASQAAVEAFAAALSAGDVGAVEYAATTPTEAAADFTTTTEGLGDFSLSVTPGPVAMAGSGLAEAPLVVTWSFPDTDDWVTDTTVAVQELGGRWLVRWDVATLESSLVSGDRLQRERIPARRAEVLGRDGSVLVSEANFVRVGIRPSRVEDLPTLVGQLQALITIDPDDVTARVQAAGPDDFVEIAVLPRAQYEGIREQIFPLPGTVFQEQIRPVADDPSLARALLGRSGEVTAEVIEANPGLFAPGDYAGLSGLQAAYNQELAGRAGTRITVLRAPVDPTSTTTGTGLTTTSALRDPTVAQELAVVEPAPGQQVVITIDPAIQAAAEAALDGRSETSALVAVEVSTGEVVAVANGPRGATVNFAMTGQYPPGSIFKVVSGYALLANNLGAGDAVDCPQTITVDGRSFANAENEVLGVIPFRTAFAHSCNTAFVGATAGFAPDTLTEAAVLFGIGDDTPIGAAAFTGDVPVSDTSVDLAAASFGQGRILMSPFSAAVMAATAADGVYRSPRLVTSPGPGPQETVQLQPQAAATLRDLMRAVVTEGTGRAVAGVPGQPVSGKTGTAEFGNQVPPQSHAWFVGYQGNLAFAVFVEAGEFGGSTAAPIAANFLSRLAAPAPRPTTTTTPAGDDATTTTAPTETSTTDTTAAGG